MTHREKFRASEISKGFQNVIDSVQFQAAKDAAMLHFMSLLNKPSSQEEAAANDYRRQGAQAFLDTLENLKTENEKPTQLNRGNLRPV